MSFGRQKSYGYKKGFGAKKKGDSVRIANIWENVSEEGETYYTGNFTPDLDIAALGDLNNFKLNLYFKPAEERKSETDPAFSLYAKPKQPRPQKQSATRFTPKAAQVAADAAPADEVADKKAPWEG